jgi:anaerobic selenocysteine-containing dehydrogenase
VTAVPVTTRIVNRQCQLCEAHCGIRVHLDDDVVTRIDGDPADVMSHGYICPKATALADVHADPERLRTPMRRVGDRFEPITWDEAFTSAGERMRALRAEHGRDAVGLYQGNPTAHSTAALALEALKKVLRSRNLFSASSVDQFPQYVAALEMFGDHTMMPVADVERTDHLLVIGANPAVSNGSVTTMPDARSRLKAIRARGGTVVVIDPRRTETARLADEHVAIRPGGDPHLLLAMLHVIMREGLTMPPRWLDGVDEVRAIVADRTPEWAEPHCGVEAQTIRRMAREFAGARSAVAYGRIGVCHHTTGTVTHWLINVLNAVTGNLDSPGGAMFTTPPVDLGRVLRVLWGRSAHGRFHSRDADLPELHGELPVVAMPDEITRPGPRQLRGLITVAGNPALSSPDAARVDAALQQLDLLICVDLYITETSRHADLILPPMSHLERSELDIVFPYFSVRNNARYSPRAVDPAPGALEDADIVLRLAAELPAGPGAAAVRALLRSVVDAVSLERVVAVLVATGPQGPLSRRGSGPWRRGRDGLTAAKVKAMPGGVDLGPLEPRLPGMLRTPDKRVHLVPDALRPGLADLDAPAPAASDGGDLQLIGRRHLRTNNSWLHNVPAMVKGKDRCTALLHPDDAAARGLVDGDVVSVTSAVGRIEVPVEISDEIRPGVVAIPHGWGHDVPGVGWSTAAANAGANTNLLTDASLVDRLSGNAALNATMVSVEAAAP